MLQKNTATGSVHAIQSNMARPRGGCAAPPQGGNADGPAKPVPRRSRGKCSKRHGHGQRGLTLVELIVALALAGVLTIVPGAIVIWFVRNYIAKGFAMGRV